ncbi:hypothetical protein OWV82_022829 [Melia azedarach]|uniref:Uncharacterized protein n=1 Tax=Melia azedarach TaxID=155640 RepID=A0ACC1WV65_MELAZ|nr:hypothetical protein OWV82_022829 [Melia azedarach]
MSLACPQSKVSLASTVLPALVAKVVIVVAASLFASFAKAIVIRHQPVHVAKQTRYYCHLELALVTTSSPPLACHEPGCITWQNHSHCHSLLAKDSLKDSNK